MARIIKDFNSAAKKNAKVRHATAAIIVFVLFGLLVFFHSVGASLHH